MDGKANGNQPAAPAIKIKSGDNYNPDVRVYHSGMTKREAFAMAAMQALLSDSTTMGNINKDARERGVDPRAYIGSACCEFADALLHALSQQPEAKP